MLPLRIEIYAKGFPVTFQPQKTSYQEQLLTVLVAVSLLILLMFSLLPYK
jgi:hypothetical protein